MSLREKQQIYFTKKILLVAGIIEIAVGLLHFTMPYFAYQTEGFSQLAASEINFVTLVIFAVGILLIAFGSLTILFSRMLESMLEVVYYYVVIKMVLWIGRVVLELLYPIQLSMFYVEPFTLVVLPGLVLELVLFIVAVVLIQRVLAAKRVGVL